MTRSYCPYNIETPTINIVRLSKDVPLPKYMTDGSVAFDLVSAEDKEILPGTSAHIHTGIIIDVNSIPGVHVQVFPRSSLFRQKKLLIANSTGVIDTDYASWEDEIILFVFAPITREHILSPGKMNEPICIQKGERLAQARLTCYVRAQIVELDEPRQKQPRGGFGSTGGYK